MQYFKYQLKSKIPMTKRALGMGVWNFFGNGKWEMGNVKRMRRAGLICMYNLIIFFLCLAPRARAASSCDPQTELCHPFAEPGKATSLTLVIGTALKSIIGMLGVLAFIVIVVAAVRWMAAQGNPETVQKSRDTIVWAALGLVLAATSYAILEFAFGTLRGAFYNP